MRYSWPDGQQCAVVLSFDFDAESGFLFREPEKAKRSLADLEERRFGPRVGVDRILRMLERLRLPASFFIPGWTVEHHLPQSKLIRDAGHEVGAHGNVHEAADPARVFQLWSREFAGMYREGACFVLTCHPFISGRASRIMLIEDLVAYMRSFPGVWFTTCAEVARWHADSAGGPARADS